MSSAGFNLGPRRHPRRMSLTPMIDVVFLLLIFFMLSSRFGTDSVVPIVTGSQGAGSAWQGPPRLVDISPDGLKLNGVNTSEAALPSALAQLMTDPFDTIILRPRDEADLQRLVAVMDQLRAAGMQNMILIE